MKKQIFLLSFICFSIVSYSQFADYKTTIGFTCGGTGSSTPIIDKANNFLYTKKYKKFVSMLYSKKAAENFIGVIVCEKLNDQKILSLSEKDLAKISEIYKSHKIVEICRGCTEIDNIELFNFLNNNNQMREEANDWMNRWMKTLNGR